MRTKRTLLIMLLSLTVGAFPALAQGSVVKSVGKEFLESAGKAAAGQAVQGGINSKSLTQTVTPKVSVPAIKPSGATQGTPLIKSKDRLKTTDLIKIKDLPDPNAFKDLIAATLEQDEIFHLRMSPRFFPIKVVSGTILSDELIHLSDATVPRPSPKMAPKQGKKRSNRK